MTFLVVDLVPRCNSVKEKKQPPGNLPFIHCEILRKDAELEHLTALASRGLETGHSAGQRGQTRMNMKRELEGQAAQLCLSVDRCLRGNVDKRNITLLLKRVTMHTFASFFFCCSYE